MNMADIINFSDYFKNRYESQKAYYSKSSAINKKKFQRWQLVLIILSALAPVFSSLKLHCPELFTYISIIVSSLVAILSSVMKIFHYHENWIKFRSTLEKLKAEEYFYHFKIGQYSQANVDADKLFVTRIETILGNEHTDWVSYSANVKAK